jgi:hypothetical protein
MTVDSRVTVAQEFFRNLYAGNVSAACDLLDQHVVYIVPGRHEVSGVFQGVQATANHLATFLRLLTEDPIDLLQWEDWMSGIDNVHVSRGFTFSDRTRSTISDLST